MDMQMRCKYLAPMRAFIRTGLAVMWAAWSASGWSADPAFYEKRSSWQETILAAEEALARQNLEDGFAPFESEVMRGETSPSAWSFP